MFKIILFLFIVAGIQHSCGNGDKDILLYKGSSLNEGSIEYSGSKKYGNYITAVKTIGVDTFRYNIKINDVGVLMHILKFHNSLNKKNSDDLDYYRDMQLLVSDTSGRYGPTFFDYPVNAYYTDSYLMNNVVRNVETQKNLVPLADEEKKLFAVIDSLAKAKHIRYNSFDTSKVLGWFKYDF